MKKFLVTNSVHYLGPFDSLRQAEVIAGMADRLIPEFLWTIKPVNANIAEALEGIRKDIDETLRLLSEPKVKV